VEHPDRVFLLRGNHETKNMNKIYGFEGEVKHKYDDTIMSLFSRLFQCLPLAATIEKKVFVVHGKHRRQQHVCYNRLFVVSTGLPMAFVISMLFMCFYYISSICLSCSLFRLQGA
jgi:hypothetical protein